MQDSPYPSLLVRGAIPMLRAGELRAPATLAMF